MAFKTLREILAVSLLAIPIMAQETLKDFDIFSGPTCGQNASELSITLEVFPDKKGNDQDFITQCRRADVNLKKWPSTNTQYNIFIDTTPIDDGCRLIFYTGAPEEDDYDTSACFQFYRAVDQGSGCAQLFIPQRFGYSYCCNNSCDDLLGLKHRRTEKSVDMELRDVTEIKRAPLLAARDDCKFTKTEGKIKTKYGKQVKAGVEIHCPTNSPLGCNLEGHAEAGQTIGTSQSTTISAGVSGAFMGIGASFGVDTTNGKEWSSSTTFGQSFTLPIAGGDNGYLSFIPKYKCGRGKFEGSTCDKALQIGEQEWCIPALIANNVTGDNPVPDGIWSVVLIN
ncbi:hypothetical protein M434DRAFT_401696 [Hypoxylon sp. CO27-5]|nr:hypothetical protein M434DRAFT_401696 [Hypoxylon sp. CO27-5]QZS37385.1 C304A protein [Hypoxylon sp. CO27-5]